MEKNAFLAAGLTSSMWGLTGIFVRLLPSFPPLTVTAGRLFVAFLVFSPVLIFAGGSRRSFFSALIRPVAHVLALLLAGYYFLATAAFQMAPVAEVALLISTPPLFVLLFRKIRGDHPLPMEIFGAFLAIAGIALILAPKISMNSGMPLRHLMGDFFAICAAGLTASYAFIYRIMAERKLAPETVGLSFLTFFSGSVILLLWLAAAPFPSGLGSLNWRSFLLFLGLGVLSTAVPTLGFAIASKRLPAVVTSTFMLLIPLFAGIFAYFFLGEGISLWFIPGGLLVLGGIILILRQKPR